MKSSSQEQAIKAYLESQKETLSKTQDHLLKKLIYFDTLVLDNQNDEVKHKLFELFFKWRISTL